YDSDSSSSTSSVSTYVTLTFMSFSISSSSPGLIRSSSSSYSISSFSNISSTVSSVVHISSFSPPAFNSTGTADVTSISMSSSNIAISECEMSSYLENSSSSSWKNCPTVIAVVLYVSVSPSIVNNISFADSKRISIPSTISVFSPCDSSSFSSTSVPRSFSNSPTVSVFVFTVWTSPSAALTTSDLAASNKSNTEKIINTSVWDIISSYFVFKSYSGSTYLCI